MFRCYFYLLIAGIVAFVLAAWRSSLERIVNLLFVFAAPYLVVAGRRLRGKKKSVVARGLRVSLCLVSVVFPVACSPQPQTLPVDTAPIPAKVRIVEQCSTLGNMLCGAVSMLSGETAVERQSACMAYIETSGRRVEQCGSLPASQSSIVSPPTKAPELTKTAHLSWKDNSRNETGFRIYRITGNQKIKIAELGPNTTTYIDKDAPPKACYLVVSFNSAGESSPTSKACLPD